ncbi:MAG: hypothetical protein DRH34_14195 [Deltaproteobacteria bacterium]|nr:MAG: hypothetical protein DRH34_14195 [Deltaproteobacteria bacterium]
MGKHTFSRFVVDTNVPKNANLASDPGSIPDELVICVQECVNSIEKIMKTGGLVLDSKNEIFDEYRGQLAMKGQPGVGDRFLKWLHYNQYSFPDSDRVNITKNGDTYDEFPDHTDLIAFDISDRKFVAVANAHPDKPPILEATDSKWWGWRNALKEATISVKFICPDYIKTKYHDKMKK